MSTVAVNPPKTPVTEGSSGIAAATVPNVCKMPGPPAPSVPTPLPNIGTSDNSPEGYSTTVTFDGHAVAIKGATFNSKGDIASQGTGGGLVSSNVQGPTSFVGPGSMNVQVEGKNVQLLGDPMLNNCGPSGSPANAATMAGVLQQPLAVSKGVLQDVCCQCDVEIEPGPYDTCAKVGEKKHACCEDKLMTQEGVGGERGYKKDGSVFTNGPRAQLPGESYWGMRGRIRGVCFPDACALDIDGNPAKFYDFKFGCPAGVPTTMSKLGVAGPLATGLSKPYIGPNQLDKYQGLAKKLEMKETEPEAISNKDCP